MIGANPVYDAPGELALADIIAAIPFTAHLGAYRDETAARCTWHLPLTHVLEGWSDIRAFDGTASIIQPLIRPLYDTRTAHQMLALLERCERAFLLRHGAQPMASSNHATRRFRRRGGGSHCRTA